MNPHAKCTGKKGGCNALLPPTKQVPIIVMSGGKAHVVMVTVTKPV